MRNSRYILILLSILFSMQFARAQTDSFKKRNDSINNQILNEYNNRIREIEQLRLFDSIKKAELESQINSLKTTDNLKKEELQKQIQELNDKEGRRVQQKKAQIDSMRRILTGFPVTGFFNDTLFVIYNKLGSFSAKDRADAISRRINKLAGLFKFHLDSIRIMESEGTTDILSGESIIMSVSENDALWNNKTKQELAADYRAIIAQAVLNYQHETNFSTLAKEIGLALIIIVLVFFLIRYTTRLFRWIEQKIREQQGKLIKGIKFKNYTLFDAGKQVNVLSSLNSFVKWLVVLLIIYIALPILFGIFPWTKNFAETLFEYILNPLKKIGTGFWNYVPNLITILVILIIFRYVLKGIRFLKFEIETGELRIPGFYTDWASPTYQIVRVLVFAFMIVVIFPYLPGSESPVFRGVSVFLGFLFTFGSAGSLSNIIAGLVLTYMRLFVIGDRVKIGEVMGDVVEKSLLVTRIRTIKNEIISIPNSTVMSSHTINYSSMALDKGLVLHTTVTIGYDVPWRNMHEVLLKAAEKTELVLKDPAPFVLQTSLDDFYVSYQLNAYTKEPNQQAMIYSTLHQNIQDSCNEAGIEIMSPHYKAMRDGNESTIPAAYRPPGYVAPAFNFKQVKEDGNSNSIK